MVGGYPKLEGEKFKHLAIAISTAPTEGESLILLI